ncbi:F-box/kelch-repeat protein [Trifolium medium]|uniref:F-box/kelch-repeat protein n=1 Tax=Trifolium medium TaxID=97028 RepID=A0A392LZ22_9FABA|nr:F-box/kelch-repeat protein [Trifolium medium]
MNDSHCPVQATPRRRRWMLCLPNLAILRRRRRMLHQPNSASPIILPDELIVEIISWLPVKSLMKLSSRCHWLCFWNPAMRTVSEFSAPTYDRSRLKYSFGYDNSAGTYKVVELYVQEKQNDLSTESYTQMLLPRGFVEVP